VGERASALTWSPPPIRRRTRAVASRTELIAAEKPDLIIADSVAAAAQANLKA
jgi:hypothetical protein